MESTCRPDVVKLPLPPGVKAGTVVGRGGHNVRWLHFHSGGAHITVNDVVITIRAKDVGVRQRATLLVRRQLEAAERLALTHGDALSLVRLEYVLLETAFGSDPQLRFRQRQDDSLQAVGVKDKLFELVPVMSGFDSSDTADSLLSGAVPARRVVRCGQDQDQEGERDQGLAAKGWTTGEQGGDGAVRFHAATACSPRKPSGCGGEAVLMSAAHGLAAAARQAACCEPAFDVMKIRFKLGKTLFRNVGPRAGKAELRLADIEGAGAGRGACQSVFSNFVPASAVPRVTSWLTGSLGFSLVDTKTTATLHVINQELNVHYSIALAMDRGDDSTASLRKLKAGGSKNHSVTLMTAPDQMDLRLKLITQFREHPGLAYDADAHYTARRVAAAVRTEGFDGFTRSKRGLPRNRHLEYARRKTKFVYEGALPAGGEGGCGQRLRVSVTQVQDDRGTHYEVSGCMPEVDARLACMLVSQRQQQRAAAAPAEPFIPEWRRGRGSGGGAPVPAKPTSDNRTHHSAGSSPPRLRSTPAAPAPPSEAESRWALEALCSLSDFIQRLNGELAAPVPPTTPPGSPGASDRRLARAAQLAAAAAGTL